MQTRPLQDFDILALAFEILCQYRCRFTEIAAWHGAIHFDYAAKLAHPFWGLFLKQKVGVVLDAHGRERRHIAACNP